jgi:KDEL-tailed cysteine endopeptidase
MSEASYPYKGVDGSCVYNSANSYNINASTYTNVTADSVSALQDALAQQPVSVSI